jgi:hypothetical protein
MPQTEPDWFARTLGLALLKKRIHFDLVDGWDHVVVKHKVHDPVRSEVGHADGSDLTLAVQFFHCAPLAIHVAERLMNEIQV